MLKNIRFLALSAAFMMISLSTTAQAKSKDGFPDRSVGISIDAIRWTFGAYIAQFEFALSDSVSLTVPLGFIAPGASFFPNATLGRFGYLAGTGVGAKFYVTGKALSHGFYLHGQLTAGFGQAGTSIPAGTAGFVPADATFAVTGNYSFKLGYTWTSSGGFMLDVFGGFNYLSFLTTNPGTAGLSGVSPTAGALIGYAW